MRLRATRAVRGAAALLLATGAAFSTSSMVAAAPAAPAPAALPPATASPAALHARYADTRAYVARAAAAAKQAGNPARAARLARMADPHRHFLRVDARGRGRVVEVFGDLATARRVAVYVPGADTSLDTYGGAGSSHPWSHAQGGARALYDAVRARHRDTAVVAWLGYDTPDLISTDVVTDRLAASGARALDAFVRRLRAGFPAASVALLCHSYGSVVCGKAAPGLDVSDIAVYGSPGMGAGSRAGLRSPARIWAGRSSGDWIGDVPHTELALLGTHVGFGTDPTRPSFGARTFAAGSGEHGDYMKPGGPALRNLADIATGEVSAVTPSTSATT